MNTYLYGLLSAMLVFSCLGHIRWKIFRCMSTLLNCSILIIIIRLIMTGMTLYSGNGDVCAGSNSVYDAESGDTWADDGKLFFSLFHA